VLTGNPKPQPTDKHVLRYISKENLMNEMKYVYKMSAITAAALLAASTLVAVVGNALAA